MELIFSENMVVATGVVGILEERGVANSVQVGHERFPEKTSIKKNPRDTQKR